MIKRMILILDQVPPDPDSPQEHIENLNTLRGWAPKYGSSLEQIKGAINTFQRWTYRMVPQEERMIYGLWTKSEGLLLQDLKIKVSVLDVMYPGDRWNFVGFMVTQRVWSALLSHYLEAHLEALQGQDTVTAPIIIALYFYLQNWDKEMAELTRVLLRHGPYQFRSSPNHALRS